MLGVSPNFSISSSFSFSFVPHTMESSMVLVILPLSNFVSFSKGPQPIEPHIISKWVWCGSIPNFRFAFALSPCA